jgi:hypothetical protein
MDIDPSEIDLIKDPQDRADFIVWLKNLTDYALKSFGMTEVPEDKASTTPPDDPPSDPVGDVIIENFKQEQMKGLSRRKESGWMKTGFPDKIDDRHI